MKVKLAQSCPTLWDPMDYIYSPWHFPGQNTGAGSLFLLQGIFSTQESNPGLQHCRQILYQLSHQGNTRILVWVAYPFLQGIFPTQELNRCLLHCRQIITWATRKLGIGIHILKVSRHTSRRQTEHVISIRTAVKKEIRDSYYQQDSGVRVAVERMVVLKYFPPKHHQTALVQQFPIFPYHLNFTIIAFFSFILFYFSSVSG